MIADRSRRLLALSLRCGGNALLSARPTVGLNTRSGQTLTLDRKRATGTDAPITLALHLVNVDQRLCVRRCVPQCLPACGKPRDCNEAVRASFNIRPRDPNIPVRSSSFAVLPARVIACQTIIRPCFRPNYLAGPVFRDLLPRAAPWRALDTLFCSVDYARRRRSGRHFRDAAMSLKLDRSDDCCVDRRGPRRRRPPRCSGRGGCALHHCMPPKGWSGRSSSRSTR
jgi:hypothetical protein